jgi:hypothetical protein
MRDVRIAVYLWIALAAARRICRKAMSPARNPKVDVEKEHEKFWNSPAAQKWLTESQREVQTHIDRETLAELVRRQKPAPDKHDAVVSAILGVAAKIDASSSRGRPSFAMLHPDTPKEVVDKVMDAVGPDAKVELVQGNA